MVNSCDQKVLNRLKRAEGQMRGIQKMIEEGKECSDIMVQLSAVRSSIDSIMGMVVAENLRQCYENPDSNEKKQSEKIEKAINLIVRR